MSDYTFKTAYNKGLLMIKTSKTIPQLENCLNYIKLLLKKASSAPEMVLVNKLHDYWRIKIKHMRNS